MLSVIDRSLYGYRMTSTHCYFLLCCGKNVFLPSPISVDWLVLFLFGLRRVDVLCRLRWSVGGNQIAVGLRLI